MFFRQLIVSERHGVTDDIHDGIFSGFLNSKDKSSAYAKIVEIIREGQENEYNEMIASLGQWGYSGEFHKMEKISKEELLKKLDGMNLSDEELEKVAGGSMGCIEKCNTFDGIEAYSSCIDRCFL